MLKTWHSSKLYVSSFVDAQRRPGVYLWTEVRGGQAGSLVASVICFPMPTLFFMEGRLIVLRTSQLIDRADRW